MACARCGRPSCEGTHMVREAVTRRFEVPPAEFLLGPDGTLVVAWWDPAAPVSSIIFPPDDVARLRAVLEAAR